MIKGNNSNKYVFIYSRDRNKSPKTFLLKAVDTNLLKHLYSKQLTITTVVHIYGGNNHRSKIHDPYINIL